MRKIKPVLLVCFTILFFIACDKNEDHDNSGTFIQFHTDINFGNNTVFKVTKADDTYRHSVLDPNMRTIWMSAKDYNGIYHRQVSIHFYLPLNLVVNDNNPLNIDVNTAQGTIPNVELLVGVGQPGSLAVVYIPESGTFTITKLNDRTIEGVFTAVTDPNTVGPKMILTNGQFSADFN